MVIASWEGGTVYKPQFFNFPDDPKAYANSEMNIMIGPAVKIATSYSQGSKE